MQPCRPVCVVSCVLYVYYVCCMCIMCIIYGLWGCVYQMGCVYIRGAVCISEGLCVYTWDYMHHMHWGCNPMQHVLMQHCAIETLSRIIKTTHTHPSSKMKHLPPLNPSSIPPSLQLMFKHLMHNLHRPIRPPLSRLVQSWVEILEHMCHISRQGGVLLLST